MEESKVENPTADVTTTVEAEPPENPEIVPGSATELSQEDKSTTEELTQGSNIVTKEPTEMPEVHFAPGHTSISYVPEEDSISVISVLLAEFTGHFFAGLPRTLSMEIVLPVDLQDRFTQTFFKAMTKVSKRRFVEIINMEVDHEDPNLIFFCPSYELMSTFKETDEYE